MCGHYIIFHPKRALVDVTASIIKRNKTLSWQGKVFVDRVKNGTGNEDPYVFNDPWLYSYCKIRYLLPKFKPPVENGSILLFCNGSKAAQRRLEIDTVFVVAEKLPWVIKSLNLPEKYAKHQDNPASALWNNHFKFGIGERREHPGRFTIEAKMHSNGSDYSFLPYSKECHLVEIDFSEISNSTVDKINSNIKGKYPVLLEDSEILPILNIIREKSCFKVVGDVKRILG
jgi:hypothetical protein